MRASWLAVALVAVASTAWAGRKSHNPVEIIVNSEGDCGTVGWGHLCAFGSLGSARNSRNTIDAIGCRVFAATGPWASYTYAERYAQSASSELGQITCFAWDPDLIAAARSVGSDSSISFLVDFEGQCLEISVDNGSPWQPKL